MEEVHLGITPESALAIGTEQGKNPLVNCRSLHLLSQRPDDLA